MNFLKALAFLALGAFPINIIFIFYLNGHLFQIMFQKNLFWLLISINFQNPENVDEIYIFMNIMFRNSH